LARTTGVSGAILDELKDLRELATLDLSFSPVGDVGLERVAELRSLRALRLVFCANITNQKLAVLRDLPNLEELTLDNAAGKDRGIGDVGAAHLGQLTGLRKLSLLGSKVKDKGLAQLQGLTGLLELNLDSCKLITDEGLASLKPLKELRDLNL